jgi:multiple sugar transport system permease protein
VIVRQPISETAPRSQLRGATLLGRVFSGNLRDSELAILLLAPSAVLLVGIMLYPMLNVFLMSLRVQNTLEPSIVTTSFENFSRLFSDKRFLDAFTRTIWFGFLTVTGSFLVGLPLALLANLETGWRWLVRVALLLPWAMPQIITGTMFAWMFNSQYGVFNDILVRLGFERIYWLIRPDSATVALVLTVIWKTSSFVALILLGGLQSIPLELSEAAQVDGATSTQIFWRITLPLLRPAIAVALIFRTLSALQVFDIPYAFMSAGASQSLETLGVYVQKQTVEFTDFGYGSTVSLGLFALSLVITVIYLRFIRPEES